MIDLTDPIASLQHYLRLSLQTTIDVVQVSASGKLIHYQPDIQFIDLLITTEPAESALLPRRLRAVA